MGNNIPWSITPWIVGGGQQPNVVKVDGPGGYNYGITVRSQTQPLPAAE
jgi:hypothetical protein